MMRKKNNNDIVSEVKRAEGQFLLNDHTHLITWWDLNWPKVILAADILVGLISLAFIGWVIFDLRPEVEKPSTCEEARQDGLTGVVGFHRDGTFYITDETAIIGPYTEIPSLKLRVLGTDVIFDTAGMSLSLDQIERHHDLRNEREVQLNDDSYAACGLARFEDGEIYAYVYFMQDINNMGIPYKSVKIAMAGDASARTAEEKALLEEFNTLLDKGQRDIQAYDPKGVTSEVALGYCADNLRIQPAENLTAATLD